MKMISRKSREGLNLLLHGLLVLILLSILVLTAYMQDKQIVIEEDEYQKIVTSAEKTTAE